MEDYIIQRGSVDKENSLQNHYRNISMSGNIILPKSVVIGSESGIQVLDAHDADLYEIISNHCSNISSKNKYKEDSQCPTPCFKDSIKIKANKKSFISCVRKNSIRKVDFDKANMNKEENKENCESQSKISKLKSSVHSMMKELNLTRYSSRMPLQQISNLKHTHIQKPKSYRSRERN